MCKGAGLPLPMNFLIFELKMVRFGAFWVLFLPFSWLLDNDGLWCIRYNKLSCCYCHDVRMSVCLERACM